MTKKIKPKAKPHYVNNRDFSLAVVEYVKSVHAAKDAEKPIPKVTNYVATCFMKISEGLSHRPNFVRYTYREEMVMDGVENCLRAINNYKIETATRTGNPNAFSYFTQICFFAFIRRITKEKKQQDVKMKYISQSGIDMFLVVEAGSAAAGVAGHFVDTLRDRIDKVKEYDSELKVFAKAEKKRKKPIQKVDSELTGFFE